MEEDSDSGQTKISILPIKISLTEPEMVVHLPNRFLLAKCFGTEPKRIHFLRKDKAFLPFGDGSMLSAVQLLSKNS